jgi:hypothetical protein
MKSFKRSKNSENLTQFIKDVSDKFEFDSAEVYHLTHQNVNQYKHIIISGIDAYFINRYGVFGQKKSDSITKEVTEFYEITLMNALPISLIVFSHNYASSIESELLFYKEVESLILFDNDLSTIKLSRKIHALHRLYIDENYNINPKVESSAYESSTTYGPFELMTFLLPFNNESSLIDSSRHDSSQRKLELQVRTLRPHSDRNQKLNMPPLDKLKRFDPERGLVFNTRLIYNNEVIFSEYDISMGNEYEIVKKHLTPFIENIEKNYEVISEMKRAPTKEYYDYYKANLAQVIEMAQI